MTGPARPLAHLPARRAGGESVLRALPEETPVALVGNGESFAVMMATPADLEDFALGFALSEGIAATPVEVEEIELVESEAGIEARMSLKAPAAARIAARRRAMAGPVGCGLCGIESLAQALRPLPQVDGAARLTESQALAALAALRDHQPLRAEAGALHGAGFWREGAMLMAREDVGRHNALDKLIGALARAGIDPASGAVVLSSRFSVEMAQKCVSAGAGIALAAASPTARAARIAAEAGLCLAAPARGTPGRLDIFGAARIAG